MILMKIALNVKNTSKIVKPSKDNIILYDGCEWYVTTKNDLFCEYQAKIDALILENNQVKQDNERFKQEISSQILKMSEIIRNLYSKTGV